MTPLFKKLNFKDHREILILNAPDSFDRELVEISKFTTVHQDDADLMHIKFCLVFATTQVEIDQTINALFPKLEGDAVIWYAYPKGTSKKYHCEFNRDNGWKALGAVGLEGVRQVAIDEDWSALRFRKVEFIKKFTRKPAHTISKEGKKRAGRE